MFLSGGIYILNAIFTRDILSVQSNEGLVVMLAGLLTFGLAWLVRRGHGWIKYLMLVCIVLNIFMTQPGPEGDHSAPVGIIAVIIMNILQIWAMVLMFMIPKGVKVILE